MCGGVTDGFMVKVGLHQGLALSPCLFAMVIDRTTDPAVSRVIGGAPERKKKIEFCLGEKTFGGGFL